MNNDPLLLHLHLPKTGGRTLNQYIYDQLCAPEYYEDEDGYLHAGIYYYPDGFFKDSHREVNDGVAHVLGRSDLRAVVGHFSFGVHKYVVRPWTYITIIRHPVDRVTSLYYHLQREGKLSVTLEEFATCERYPEVQNDQTRRISGMATSSTQSADSMFERAVENLRNEFSVVGTTDRFDHTLTLLKLTFGWSKDFVYYLENVNLDRPETTTLPDKTCDAILSRNRYDLQLYNLANELLEGSIERWGGTFEKEFVRLEAQKDPISES